MGEESDDSKKISGLGTKAFEQRGGKRDLDGICQALLFRLEHTRLAVLPLLRQSIVVPLVLMCDSGQQGHREWVEVELCEDLVDLVWSLVVAVDAIEGLACGLDRQCRDVQAPAIWGYGRDAGCDDKTDIAELSQFLHHSIDLPFIGTMWVQNRLGIIEDNNHFFRG